MKRTGSLLKYPILRLFGKHRFAQSRNKLRFLGVDTLDNDLFSISTEELIFVDFWTAPAVIIKEHD